MTITKEKTAQLVKKFGANEKDTGNPAVQVAILTQRINSLTEHLKEHKRSEERRVGKECRRGFIFNWSIKN